MKIDNDHMYYGAALTQIAEHPRFTAINVFKNSGVSSRCSFRINSDIGVYLKYASKPKKPYDEYVVTFSEANRDELKKLKNVCSSTYVALVCVQGRQVCVLSHDEFSTLVKRRRAARKAPERQYTLLATLPSGKSFRVYVNAPGKRKTILGKEMIVSRNRFPGLLFE